MGAMRSLDSHAHIDPSRRFDELAETGAVLAATLSLDEAGSVIRNSVPHILWGAGCHPRKLKALQGFNPARFCELLQRTPLVSEIGLDRGARTPLEHQLGVFRQILEIIQDQPRLVSIHCYQATDLVLEELRRKVVIAPILHWWTGSAAETCQAVELGCYFSIHTAVARHSKFRLHVPIERVLVESDHGWSDPPAAIPCRIRWVEYLVAKQYGREVDEVRAVVWGNLRSLVQKTGTGSLFPEQFMRSLEGGVSF